MAFPFRKLSEDLGYVEIPASGTTCNVYVAGPAGDAIIVDAGVVDEGRESAKLCAPLRSCLSGRPGPARAGAVYTGANMGGHWKMIKRIVFVVVVLTAALAAADTLHTRDGKVFKNIKSFKTIGTSVSFETADGAGGILPLSNIEKIVNDMGEVVLVGTEAKEPEEPAAPPAATAPIPADPAPAEEAKQADKSADEARVEELKKEIRALDSKALQDRMKYTKLSRQKAILSKEIEDISRKCQRTDIVRGRIEGRIASKKAKGERTKPDRKKLERAEKMLSDLKGSKRNKEEQLKKVETELPACSPEAIAKLKKQKEDLTKKLQELQNQLWNR